MKTYSAFFQDLGSILSYLLFLGLVIIYTLFGPQQISQLQDKTAREKVLKNSESLLAYLETQNRTWQSIRHQEHVPRVFPINLPRDLKTLPTPKKSKLFISLVLPNVLKANEQILKTRQKIIRLHLQEKRSLPLTQKDKDWLGKLAKIYSAKATTVDLLHRVDIIPVSLAIAQAITESGWGGSRFALDGNSLYGQHLSSRSSGRFILSRQGNVKVAAFDSIYEATLSYMHNLNSSRAYQPLRNIRGQLRNQQKNLDGYTMAQGLTSYSALGNEYVTIIRKIISKYNLEALDQSSLSHYSAQVMLKFSNPAG